MSYTSTHYKSFHFSFKSKLLNFSEIQISVSFSLWMAFKNGHFTKIVTNYVKYLNLAFAWSSQIDWQQIPFDLKRKICCCNFLCKVDWRKVDLSESWKLNDFIQKIGIVNSSSSRLIEHLNASELKTLLNETNDNGICVIAAWARIQQRQCDRVYRLLCAGIRMFVCVLLRYAVPTGRL